ncbi:AsmA family protein [Microvirga antarctica]|uniref:AsmA family protein n=1 Tax=Microvirga antarctica TaxID=2819233 RepID=UPI001B3149F3|nr:AsmA family protein [Microvirga antarctica]
MRDILTIIASVVIVILAIAVAAPPLIDWQDHRDSVDRLISRASGTEARTEGHIGIRLLPTPRIRLDRLRLGGKTPESPTLAADLVWAELALTPLLRGEVRFLETRVGRADINVSVSPDGGWRLPPELLTGNARGREWAIESLKVAQLLVTTQMPSTGRTDQIYAENVFIEGQKLIGPWRVEGSTGSVPFRLLTGELAPDKSIQVKLAGGGDSHPRFDIDARVSLTGGDDGALNIAGKAKFLFGPPAQVAAAGIPIPITLDAEFKASNGAIVLDPVSLEAGEGGASLRMQGQGSVQIAEPRIALKLEGRRLDADSFILSGNGQDFKSRFKEWSVPKFVVPVDLDLKIDSIGLGQDDLSNAIARLSLDRGQARINLFEFTAPGETRVAMEGKAGLGSRGGTEGKIALQSKSSDRFARYLERLNLRSPFLRVLDGRPFEASSDLAYISPVVSFNRLRVKTGDAVLTGNVRYTAAEANERAKLEAQVAIQNLNLDQLPRVSSVFEATQNMDVGFILDARGVTAGNRPGNGRIGARILSDGPALLVESLDIVNLAGANAKVSGRIAPDGSGRIAGTVTAERAAPLVDLMGSVWIGGLSKLVPPFLREGGLSLDVVTERVARPAGSAEMRLRTTARGTAAGGAFEGQVDSLDGRTENLDVTLATDNTGRWVQRSDVPSLKRPSKINLRGIRVGSGQFNVTVAGDVGGVKVTTGRPFTLSADDDVVDSGAAEIATPDITPFLLLLGDGAAGVTPPVPVNAQVSLGRERDASLLEIRGQVADSKVQARLAVRSRSEIGGEISLDRLSLPWLVTALALNAPGVPDATAVWSSARFGQNPLLLRGGRVTIRTAALDLGRNLRGTRASFILEATPDGIGIRELDTVLGTGKLTGSASITRQGSLASIVGEGALRDVPLSALTSAPFEARLSGGLKFGSSGETLSGLVSNLGGSGDWTVAGLRVPQTDPAALDRAAKLLLSEAEPLVAGRAEAVIGAELNRAPLAASAVTTSAALIGGGIRLSPFVVEGGPATWRGTVTFDLRSLMLDARGALTAVTSPPEWTGAAPSIGLGWRSVDGIPFRDIDVGPFRNGLAAIVLKRELEKIEAFERQAAERQRQMEARQEAERQKAKAAADELARQARIREEAEQARREAERIQAEQKNAPPVSSPPLTAEPQAISPFVMPPMTPPIELTPPPAIQVRPGG